MWISTSWPGLLSRYQQHGRQLWLCHWRQSPLNYCFFWFFCLFVLFVFVLKWICASFSLDLVEQQLQNLINPQGLFNTSIHGYLQIRFQFIVIFPRFRCSALRFIALVKKVTCVQLFLVGSLLYKLPTLTRVLNHCVLCQDIDSIGDILCVVTYWWFKRILILYVHFIELCHRFWNVHQK